MIKEELEIKQEYFQLSDEILRTWIDIEKGPKGKRVICVCGESGSGKSVTALCLSQRLNSKGDKALVLNQDGFYFLPPKENTIKRKSNIDWVGPQEVDMQLMQKAIDDFKNGESEITISIVDYIENRINQESLKVKDVDVIVVEGTYAFLLENLDCKIFLERTYIDTKEVRLARRREKYDPFVEQVLHIEHVIISKLKTKADMYVAKDYILRNKKTAKDEV